MDPKELNERLHRIEEKLDRVLTLSVALADDQLGTRQRIAILEKLLEYNSTGNGTDPVGTPTIPTP